MTDNNSPTDDRTDREPMDYGEFQVLVKDNLGTIIRDVDNRSERVRFSKTDRRPNIHSTIVEAAIWYTTEPVNPRYSGIVVRSLEGSRGRSTVSDGNKYFDTYADAVDWVESLAEEFDGEPLNWRDLPKKPVHCDGEPYVYPDADQEVSDDV